MNDLKTLGLIMDGNRRWAKERNLPTLLGHRRGVAKLKEVMAWAKSAGVENLICYTFSSENWQRTKTEVKYLLGLFGAFLKQEAAELIKNKIWLKFIGDLNSFSPTLRRLMKMVSNQTSTDYRFTLVLAVSYGGRAEILHALKRLPKLDLDEKTF